jgi:hypothetical protein
MYLTVSLGFFSGIAGGQKCCLIHQIRREIYYAITDDNEPQRWYRLCLSTHLVDPPIHHAQLS